jgi:hypothetical protein
MSYGDSMSFGNGLRSTTNATVSFAAQLLPAGKSSYRVEHAATADRD